MEKPPIFATLSQGAYLISAMKKADRPETSRMIKSAKGIALFLNPDQARLF